MLEHLGEALGISCWRHFSPNPTAIYGVVKSPVNIFIVITPFIAVFGRAAVTAVGGDQQKASKAALSASWPPRHGSVRPVARVCIILENFMLFLS